MVLGGGCGRRPLAAQGEIYQYGQNGMLLEETDQAGTPQADYIYLNGRPIATVNPATGTLCCSPLTETSRLHCLRACSRSSEQEYEEGEVDELQAGIEFPFAVFPESSALLQPSKGTFHDPAFGQHRKGV